jgi:hypothetical protein
VAGVLVCALAVIARRWGAVFPWLVALDAAALIPLFATGRTADLPPDGASAAGWLAGVFERLRTVSSLRVAPWARIVGRAESGGSHADELRLLVLPRAGMPGVVGVEVGRAWSATPVGWAGSPEVLVRVLEGSSAAAKLACLLPRVRTIPGRRADERVVRLRPRRGTRAGTAALTQGLAEALTDRRAPAPAGAWEGPVERRSGPYPSPTVAQPKAC